MMMDGIELCSVLRRHFTKKDLPFLFLTALSQTRLAQTFITSATESLTKPAKKAELKARVSSQLELSQLDYLASQAIYGDSRSTRDLPAKPCG
jgi:DNA-binding response OmpR family regulator